MLLALVGISHHSAPIDVREQLNCPAHALPDAFNSLSAISEIHEAVILSTCNRLEIYAVSETLTAEGLRAAILQHLSRFHQVAISSFSHLFYCKTDEAAAGHLLRVAGGLDSLVLGESQILGQVKQALREAQNCHAAGKILTKLFEQSIFAGKRIHAETGLGSGGFSIGHAAVDLASRIFDDFARARVLLLGAGKMSEVTARHLVRSGVQLVMVANRTHERAVLMAERLGGSAINFDEALKSGLVQADIVIASTAAPHAILRRDMLQPLLKQRRGRPLFLIDIALPRDIDPDVNDLDNVFLYNIDDLQHYVHEYAREREDELQRAEAVITEETDRFLTWYRIREVAPVISDLKSHLETIRREYMAIFAPRLAHLSEKDLQTLEALSKAMMDQVAREPITRLKQAAEGGEEHRPSPPLMEATRQLFGLEPWSGIDLPASDHLPDPAPGHSHPSDLPESTERTSREQVEAG